MAKSKNPYKKKRKPGISKASKDADKQMQATSTEEIIRTIDYLITILKSRGVYIVNYDTRNDKTKEAIGMVRMFKRQPFYMVASKEEVKDE